VSSLTAPPANLDRLSSQNTKNRIVGGIEVVGDLGVLRVMSRVDALVASSVAAVCNASHVLRDHTIRGLPTEDAVRGLCASADKDVRVAAPNVSRFVGMAVGGDATAATAVLLVASCDRCNGVSG